MDIFVLIFLSSGLFLGWSLGANDAANVFGTAVGTRMVKFTTAAIVCSIFVVLGSVIDGAGAAHTLGKLGAVNAIAGAFVVAFSAAFSVYSMVKIGVNVSTGQAVVGAIVGWNLFSGNVTDKGVLLKIASTWVMCPLLAAAIAIPLYIGIKKFLSVKKYHILRLDAYTRSALILAGAFGSYVLGANNIANVMGVFVPVSPFTSFEALGREITSVEQLFFVGSIAIAVGVFTYSKRAMMTVGSSIMSMSPVAAWVVVVAHSVVLFIFASKSLQYFLVSHGLPEVPLVPVSSTQAVVGAVVGIGLTKGGKGIKWSVIGRICRGWVVAPTYACLICVICLFIVKNVFDQKVYSEMLYTFTPEVIAEAKNRGYDVKDFKMLQGKEYHSNMQIKKDLSSHNSALVKNIVELTSLSEVVNVYVSPARMDNIDVNWYGVDRIESVRELEGRKFKYQWQFRKALRKFEPWQEKEATPLNNLYNKEIEQRFESLVKEFSLNK